MNNKIANTVECRFYSIKDVMTILNIGRNKAYKLANVNGVPVMRIGNTILFEKEEFDLWIRKHIGKTVIL